MLFECWISVYDAGPTLHQHWFSIRRDGPAAGGHANFKGYIQCLRNDGLRRWPNITPTLVFSLIVTQDTRRETNVCVRLGHRLRRWPNLTQTLVKLDGQRHYTTGERSIRNEYWLPGSRLASSEYAVSVIKTVFSTNTVRLNLLILVNILKGLAQAKIIKKSVILFRLLNMTIWCKHVHRLELQKF